jgi:hypothetical protein
MRTAYAQGKRQLNQNLLGKCSNPNLHPDINPD